MQTQINCPRCRTPFPTEIVQMIDAQRTPQYKQMLLSGSLNVAVCPQCGAATQLATPMLFHDAEHQLLMVHVPMELNISMSERERLIGQMAKALTDSLPPEQFRAYMLQPQQILTFKTFMEKVYETEGITPEMLERQQNQLQLLQHLATTTDKLSLIQQVQDNMGLIDEQFFAILQSTIQSATQSPQAERQLIALSNLQAHLYTNTELGKKIEQQQLALHKFQREANAEGGLSHELFAKHLLLNIDNETVVNALIRMGQQGVSYELFQLITGRLEEAQAAGHTEEAEKIVRLREKLLHIYQDMQAQSQQLLAEAKETLEDILNAPNLAQAVQENLQFVDEPFMYYLAAEIAHAEETEDSGRLEKLRHIQALIVQEAERQLPDELRLLNQLIRLDDEKKQREILGQMPAEARQQLSAMLQAVGSDPNNSENPEIAARLERLQALLV